MNPQPVYKALATALDSLTRCQKNGNEEWADKWTNRIADIMDTAPSGSGIDSGTTLSENSHGERLLFWVDYHYMNDVGMYVSWTNHSVAVTPSLVLGYVLTVGGSDRDDICEYLAEVFSAWLDSPVEV